MRTARSAVSTLRRPRCARRAWSPPWAPTTSATWPHRYSTSPSRQAVPATPRTSPRTRRTWPTTSGPWATDSALILGGDCSILLGTALGLRAAQGAPIGLVYVDAHADYAT